MFSGFSPTSHILSRPHAGSKTVTSSQDTGKGTVTAFYSWKPLLQWVSEQKLPSPQRDFEQCKPLLEPKLNISPTHSPRLVSKRSRYPQHWDKIERAKTRVGPSCSFNRLKETICYYSVIFFPSYVRIFKSLGPREHAAHSPCARDLCKRGVGDVSFICFRANVLLNLEVGQADAASLDPDPATCQLCGEEVKIVGFEHSFLNSILQMMTVCISLVSVKTEKKCTVKALSKCMLHSHPQKAAYHVSTVPNLLQEAAVVCPHQPCFYHREPGLLRTLTQGVNCNGEPSAPQTVTTRCGDTCPFPQHLEG